MHTLTCQIATAKQQGQLPPPSFSPSRSHFESCLYSAAAVRTSGTATLGIFISCQIWVEVLQGSVGQRHTLCMLISQTKKSSEVSSQVFPKIPTRLHPSSKHQISYCRSFLHFPFQKCKCRSPSAPSNKLITAHFQNRCSCPSSQLNHWKVIGATHTEKFQKFISHYSFMKSSKHLKNL